MMEHHWAMIETSSRGFSKGSIAKWPGPIVICYSQNWRISYLTFYLPQESYKSLIRKYCEVIWKDQGVIRGISTMGSRDLPHALNIKTERGSEKIWKATWGT